MEALFLLVVSFFLGLGDLVNDPVNVAWEGRQEARQFECERLSQAEAHRRNPAMVPPPHPRATALMQIDALVCKRPIRTAGALSPRDELILGRLRDDVGELSGLAASTGDKNTHWVVDAFFPDPVMVRKITTATRVALAEQGYLVSDQPPLLSAGDAEVFRTLPVRDALPLACRRLHDSGALGRGSDEEVAFLAIALLHEKESQLHAGTCVRGEYRWLR